MLVNKDCKRRNSGPAAGTAHLDVAVLSLRQADTENSYRSLFICNNIVELWEFFISFFFSSFDRTWRPVGGVSKKVVKLMIRCVATAHGEELETHTVEAPEA